MKTRIGDRLDFWGWTIHAAAVKERLGFAKHRELGGAREDRYSPARPAGMVPTDCWESWATDLEIDRTLEDEA